jgi:hypothetical protein
MTTSSSIKVNAASRRSKRGVRDFNARIDAP